MAVGIVEVLEVIEVAKHQRQRPALASCRRNFGMQHAVEPSAIDQARERIELHHFVELLIRQMQLCRDRDQATAHVQQAAHGAQLGDQHNGFDGFDQVVVAPRLNTAPDVQIVVQAGEKDDGCPLAGLGLAQLTRDPIAVLAGEADVQQHQIGSFAAKQCQRGAAVFGFQHVRHTGLAQFGHQGSAHDGLILDNQHGERRRGIRRREPCPA